MSESWMLRLLATETSRHHANADGARLGWMERPSALRYRAALTRAFGFEQPVEVALANTPRIDRTLLASQLKTDYLASDLTALGVRPESAMGDGESIPAFDDVGHALGWLYVLQRNALFHGVIRRQLAMVLPDEIRLAGSYLGAFEGELGIRMRQLGAVLDRLATKHSIAWQVVEAADEAFRYQRRWYTPEAAKVVLSAPSMRRRALVQTDELTELANASHAVAESTAAPEAPDVPDLLSGATRAA